MSDEGNTNKHYHEFEITEQGMALRQAAIAGASGKDLKIEFTRGAIGGGRPSPEADLYFMVGLISPLFDVPIKESYAQNQSHIMTVVIDNSNIQEEVLMTEIGIFARLVDTVTNEIIVPEILYGYTYTYKYDYIPVGREYPVYREISFDTVLSKNGKFEIVYDKTKVYATHQDIEDALRHVIVASKEQPTDQKAGQIWRKIIDDIEYDDATEYGICLTNLKIGDEPTDEEFFGQVVGEISVGAAFDSASANNLEVLEGEIEVGRKPTKNTKFFGETTN